MALNSGSRRGPRLGTVIVDDIDPGATSSFPFYLTNLNGMLYFQASDGTNCAELWKSDGTAAGTMMVKDIDPGANSSVPSYVINVNSELYFTANDGAHGYELWKSDGTAAGTVMVKDIDAGAGSSTPFDFAAINGGLNSTPSTARTTVCSGPMGPPRARSNLLKCTNVDANRRNQRASPFGLQRRRAVPTSYGRTRAARPRSGA